MRVKLVVNEPTLWSPTEKQMSATEWSVVRSIAGGALEPARQQIRVRRFAERPAELAAEMSARQPRRAGEVVDVERLEVPRVGQVLGAEQMPVGGYEGHERPHYPGPARCLESGC